MAVQDYFLCINQLCHLTSWQTELTTDCHKDVALQIKLLLCLVFCRQRFMHVLKGSSQKCNIPSDCSAPLAYDCSNCRSILDGIQNLEVTEAPS